jgi:hypothetical protein
MIGIGIFDDAINELEANIDARLVYPRLSHRSCDAEDVPEGDQVPGVGH